MKPSKKIILIRHAQTVFNSEQIIQGQSIDSELSDVGYKQAEIFHKKIKHIPFDKIYISGLRRSYDSAKSFIEANIPFEIMPELNELNWGVIEGNRFEGETKQKYSEVVTYWKNGNYDAKIETGESVNEVVRRLKRAIDYILQMENEETILIVTHNRTLKILLCILLEMEVKEMDQFSHKNLTMYQLQYTYNKFIFQRKLELSEIIGI